MRFDSPSDTFYDVSGVSRFHARARPGFVQPLPDDWAIGVADVVQSTKPSATITTRRSTCRRRGDRAVTNALEGRDFPFVFGGDGASFAVPPAARRLRVRR